MAAGKLQLRAADGTIAGIEYEGGGDLAFIIPTSGLLTNESIDSKADKTDTYTKSEVDTALNTKVPTTRTVAGKALSANITLVKGDVGLANVDNTSDLNKPVSTATQTALNAKQNTITGGATTITGSNLTASRALISDAAGKVAVSDVTSTQLEHLSGVTGNIQTQLDSKQATLVSGTNIKTVNGTSILGSGDIAIASSDPTSAQVGTATAGLGAGAVGSYGFLNASTGVINFGETLAGSNLRPVGISDSGYTITQNIVQAGTWRCMGYSPYGSPETVTTLWLRIS